MDGSRAFLISQGNREIWKRLGQNRKFCWLKKQKTSLRSWYKFGLEDKKKFFDSWLSLITSPLSTEYDALDSSRG